jgi:hypothetical protein
VAPLFMNGALVLRPARRHLGAWATEPRRRAGARAGRRRPAARGPHFLWSRCRLTVRTEGRRPPPWRGPPLFAGLAAPSPASPGDWGLRAPRIRWTGTLRAQAAARDGDEPKRLPEDGPGEDRRHVRERLGPRVARGGPAGGARPTRRGRWRPRRRPSTRPPQGDPPTLPRAHRRPQPVASARPPVA